MAGRVAFIPSVAVAAALLAAVPATAPPISPAATTLYMGGTFDELSLPQDSTDYISYYVGQMSRVYVAPTGLCTGGSSGCTAMALYTPEQFRLLTGLSDMTFDDSVAAGVVNLDACLRGLHSCVVTAPPYTATTTTALTDSVYTVLGYSQSATIATDEKRALIANPPEARVSFVLVANPNRPNGGILERFAGAYIPLIGVSFNGATPTDSAPGAPLTTVDVVGQYDMMSDFPTNPLNLLADLNALLGYYFVHLKPFDANSAELQGQYQDSTYYLVPTTTLPLLTPIAQIPWVGPFVTALLDPPLRVLVESAYDRTINPGSPTPAQWFYIGNPVATAINLLKAIPTGWDNAIAYVTGDPTNRPFGTQPQPTYGVGGPPVNAGAIDPYGPPTPYQPAPADQPPAATDLTAAVTSPAPAGARSVAPPTLSPAAASPAATTTQTTTPASTTTTTDTKSTTPTPEDPAAPTPTAGLDATTDPTGSLTPDQQPDADPANTPRSATPGHRGAQHVGKATAAHARHRGAA